MKLAQSQLSDLITQFAERYVAQCIAQTGKLPIVEHDPDWPSPCEQVQADEQPMHWQPKPIEDDVDFSALENAIEITLHNDIKTYFSTIYSNNLPAISEHGNLELLFAWNYADFERLQENIIGHILMKRRLKQKMSVFFAVTDEDDLIISLDNETGSIGVERIGCEAHQVIATSMAEFITLLTPVTPS